MSLGENSLVAAYQGKGQLKSRPSGTRVVTVNFLNFFDMSGQRFWTRLQNVTSYSKSYSKSYSTGPSRNPENGWRTRAATGGMESLTIPKTNVIQHVKGLPDEWRCAGSK